MPPKLDIRHESLTYNAAFLRPPFSLWGKGGQIVEGIYESLSPYNVSMRDIQIHANTSTANDTVVSVNVGNTVLKYSFSGIEVVFTNLSEEEFFKIPQFLEASTSWVKKIVPEIEFASHAVNYFQHSALQGMKVEEFLAKVNPPTSRVPGIDLGSGVIFNRSLPEKSWTVQVMIDRSGPIPGALYFGLNIRVGKGSIEYQKFFKDGLDFYAESLEGLGLTSRYLEQRGLDKS